eukprot:PhF_6_TR31526/c0_g1_i2/m.46471
MRVLHSIGVLVIVGVLLGIAMALYHTYRNWDIASQETKFLSEQAMTYLTHSCSLWYCENCTSTQLSGWVAHSEDFLALKQNNSTYVYTQSHDISASDVSSHLTTTWYQSKSIVINGIEFIVTGGSCLNTAVFYGVPMKSLRSELNFVTTITYTTLVTYWTFFSVIVLIVVRTTISTIDEASAVISRSMNSSSHETFVQVPVCAMVIDSTRSLCILLAELGSWMSTLKSFIPEAILNDGDNNGLETIEDGHVFSSQNASPLVKSSLKTQSLPVTPTTPSQGSPNMSDLHMHNVTFVPGELRKESSSSSDASDKSSDRTNRRHRKSIVMEENKLGPFTLSSIMHHSSFVGGKLQLEEDSPRSKSMYPKRCTALCIHIFGLDSHAETDPIASSSLASEVLSKVNKYSQESHGVIIHTDGCTAVVMWNAFKSIQRHEAMACNMALSLHTDFQNLPPSIRLHMYITTATMLIGFVGDLTRRSIAVLSQEYRSTVTQNVRLNHVLKTNILMSAATRDGVGEMYNSRVVDYLQGSNLISPVYELCVNPINFIFNEAMSDFRAGHLLIAREKFETYISSFCQDIDQQAVRLWKLTHCAPSPLKNKGTPLGSATDEYIGVRKHLGWEVFGPELDEMLIPPGLRNKTKGDGNPSSEEDLLTAPQVRTPVHRRLDSKAFLKAVTREVEEGQEADTLKTLNADEDEVQDYDENAELDDDSLPSEVVCETGELWHRSDKLIGKGVQGEVWLGVGDDCKFVAMKFVRIPRQINGDPSKVSAMQQAAQETVLMSRLRHENIVGYVYGTVLKQRIVSIMEYVSAGSLET